ncbi:integrase catalytic domain-containing protein [Trichonephila clavipes]|uniref:Integrase catalytic domain-containing protein n=1 Tax=Trichonephila clavipes TaxID=2585209 RepID=A0A8X6RLE2_TRICX|nr:integrase catalytic domain-containing protein [Trichonephila clavipes]
MDKLNNSKRAIKGTITKIETFVEESGNHTPTKLDIKLKRVQEMNRKIDELKDQYYDIKDISESELQVIEADIQSMEDRLEELEVRIRDILNSFIAKSSVSSVHNHENAISQANSKLKLEIKLPEMPLPVFRASLQGDAKLLEAVDDSFESLITALKTRFENKRLLTETHINAILEIEKLTSESARDIRTMTDILSKNIRALKLLGFERNNLSDLILLNIILKKIDRETRKQFEQSIDSNQIPELDTFIMFLEKRSQTIDSINRSAPITHKPKQVPFHKDDLSKRSNNYTKLLHILNYIFRFLHNSRNPSVKRSGQLDYIEVNEAELCLIKNLQASAFQEEIEFLAKSSGCSKKGKLFSLNPFLDGNQILRVGRRLQNSDLTYSQKHPAILPADHLLTKLIMINIHNRNFHLGPQALLYCTTQRFWPLRGRSIARKIVHECVVCFKNKPIVANHLMGSLPREETSKAVHLEIVSDLTTDAFLATLKRFVARREKCATISSDNAKNFVGANRELKRLHNLLKFPEEKLSSYLSSEGISWNFMPPRAPNFGGLWEAGVKSFKFYLKRAVGNLKMTLEEFLTIITQIEGILNSRPITPLSEDIDDLEVLTPGHFLIGRPITSISEPNLLDKTENTLSRWQKLTKIVQHIWTKWSRDYLNNLQQRNKWQFHKDNVKLNTMVLIKDDNLPVNKWSLGRITKLAPGTDGKVRVVEIKTNKGNIKRSIGKVCVLPLDN